MVDQGSKSKLSKRTSPAMQVLIKSLLTLYLLMSHWPKQDIRPGPESMWKGLHKGSEYWGSLGAAGAAVFHSHQ